ncbi:MAG: acetate--CoA ligase family protein [Salinirussus sp.]
MGEHAILADLFSPERVAVVGATDRAGSVGRALIENLERYRGELLPVNPDRDEVLGEPCFHAIADLPNPQSIDLAVVAVPAPAVVEVLRELGEAGIRTVVVISAGFSEVGDAGREREDALIDVAEQYELRLVGPNSVGVLSIPDGLNATFAQGRPPAGSISLMSQSGAFIAAVLGWATQHDVGFRHVVSLGNEAVLDEVDFIEAWGADPDTDVILAYLEDINNGRQFVERARDVTSDTPIVVLKSGRTAVGAEAAASHTGSMAGSDRAVDAGLNEAGAIRASNVREAFDTSRALAGQPLPDGDNVAVVTNGGGPGVLAADAIGDSRLSLATFDADLRADLEEMLPDQATPANPLDIIGDADLDRFRRCLDHVLANDAIDAAVVMSIPTALFEFPDLADVIGSLSDRHDTPVVTCLMGGSEATDAETVLRSYGIPNYFDPAEAVPSLATLADYRDIRDRPVQTATEFAVDRQRVEDMLLAAAERGQEYLGVEAMEILDAYGISTPANGLATSAEEAVHIADQIGGSVVLKLVSPDIIHKSDVGGVAVGVPPGDVDAEYESMVKRAREHDSDAELLGVHVEELVDLPESTETIVGVTRDPQFGHLVMFGLGGIFVQVFEDAIFRLAPVTEREAREMTTQIQAAPMLHGARGRDPADIDAIVETIQRISQLATDFPAIAELDVNPLVVSPDGVSAVDFRLRFDAAELTGDR